MGLVSNSAPGTQGCESAGKSAKFQALQIATPKESKEGGTARCCSRPVIEYIEKTISGFSSSWQGLPNHIYHIITVKRIKEHINERNRNSDKIL
jgi:hypothetical protein